MHDSGAHKCLRNASALSFNHRLDICIMQHEYSLQLLVFVSTLTSTLLDLRMIRSSPLQYPETYRKIKGFILEGGYLYNT